MTVNTPEFDEQLEGHSAVVLEGICHAVVSSYEGDGSGDKITECGESDFEPIETNARKNLTKRSDEICPDCWPEHIWSS